jgi:hypothetical protein
MVLCGFGIVTEVLQLQDGYEAVFLAHSYGTFVMSWVLHFRTLAYLERSGENLR